MKKTTLILGLAGILGAGCTPSAETRIKKHFGIEVRGEPSETQIRTAVLAKLPVGTPADQIYAYLDKAGFAEGSKSVYYKPREEPVNHANTNEIWCSIDYANRPWRLIYVSYGVNFQLDASGCLTNVVIGRGLTGM